MNNKEFVSALAARLGIVPKEAQKRIDGLVETLATQLEQGNEVAVSGFGTFEVKKRNERVIVNPASGKRMLVPPKLTVNFKESSSLKTRGRANTDND